MADGVERVTGRPHRYGLLDRPAMLLFERGARRYLSTPEAGGDGAFCWRLPPGDYGVAVLRGGVSPADEMHAMVNGPVVTVLGFVDPGIEFTAGGGARIALGTLTVTVRTKRGSDIWGSRVFGALEGMRVAPEPGAGEPAAFRLLARPSVLAAEPAASGPG